MLTIFCALLTLLAQTAARLCQIAFMATRKFTFDSYAGPDEAFHFARRQLAGGDPGSPHSHDCYELFLVERGLARHAINGRQEVLPTGTLVFVRPGDCHALAGADRAGCGLLNVMFRSATADALIARYGDDLGGRFFWRAGTEPDSYHLEGPRLERAINVALEVQGARRGLLQIETFLMTIMGRVVDIQDGARQGAPEWLLRACRAARTKSVFRGGAAGFVAVAGRGHEHVCRIARQHLGMTPTAYVNRIRMEHAAMLLGRTDMTVSEIAEDVGIENLSHFYRVFRQNYGATPGAYRRRRQLTRETQ
ncbi:AraC family transcriptional regulator [Rhodobacteraceae bacterium CCMM004]|nr:AraC family transcriptional regulator [Rhodobacteraceae bacterium CCMM004]